MHPTDFRKGIGEVLASHGFVEIKDGWARPGTEVGTLVGFEKGFGSQWYVSVGFWLRKLEARQPERVERCHMYYRLERVVPNAREVVLTAGDFSCAEQALAYAGLIDLMGTDVLATLNELQTEQGLRDGLAQGRLSQGLVTKAARQHLLG